MSIHVFHFFFFPPNHSVALIYSFNILVSLLPRPNITGSMFLLHPSAIMSPHSALGLRSVTSFLPSWTESGFSDCCVPSGYFRSHYVNGGNWNVDSVSQREAMAKDTTAKPALLLSAYLARATLPNPLFAFNSVCRSCQAQVWWCLNALLKFHPSNKNGEPVGMLSLVWLPSIRSPTQRGF